MCPVVSSRGVSPRPTASAAAVPAASPPTAHVAITRVVPNATCDAEIVRPAIHMFVTLREYRQRSGMW
jgi:hypothetical protein